MTGELADLSFLFLDCQTTGANPQSGRLLEIAWLNANARDEEHGEIISTLVRQPEGEAVPPRIQMLTGITESEMLAAEPEERVFSQLCQAADGGSGISPARAIVHYARFERPFLQDLFMRLGESDLPFEIICTHEIARRLFPNIPARGIRGLSGYFGESTDELKRSASHVKMTRMIWKQLVARLSEQGIGTVSQLNEWLAEPVKKKKTRYQFLIDEKKRLSLPEEPGIYRMLDRQGRVLYVGKATSLRSRVNSYFRGRKGRDAKKLEMLAQTWDIETTITGSALEAALLETDEIKRHNPPYNINLKKGRRQLAFYSSDFTSLKEVQDAEHPLGPFSGQLALDPFLRLAGSIKDDSFDSHIFFDEIAPDRLAEGFALFCEAFDLEPARLAAPRALMAVALRLFRAYKRELEELESSELQESEEPTESAELTADDGARTGANDSQESKIEVPAEIEAEIDVEAELTPEEIADKIHRLLIRSARLYLRARSLTAVLNCRVEFLDERKKGAGAKSLEVVNGKIAHLNEVSDTIADCSNAPDQNSQTRDGSSKTDWLGHDLETYDRMSILLQELGRLARQEQLISIEQPSYRAYLSL